MRRLSRSFRLFSIVFSSNSMETCSRSPHFAKSTNVIGRDSSAWKGSRPFGFGREMSALERCLFGGLSRRFRKNLIMLGMLLETKSQNWTNVIGRVYGRTKQWVRRSFGRKLSGRSLFGQVFDTSYPRNPVHFDFMIIESLLAIDLRARTRLKRANKFLHAVSGILALSGQIPWILYDRIYGPCIKTNHRNSGHR